MSGFGGSHPYVRHTNVLTGCSSSDSALWERGVSVFWPVLADKNGWGTSSSGNWYPEDCVDPLNLQGKFRIPGKKGQIIRFTESLERTTLEVKR